MTTPARDPRDPRDARFPLAIDVNWYFDTPRSNEPQAAWNALPDSVAGGARERLAAALAVELSGWETFDADDGFVAIRAREPRNPTEIADALLPVVQALMAEHAAAELEKAAAAWSEFRLPTDQLRDRAAGLRAAICQTGAGQFCECGDYDTWEYEVCEACGLPAPPVKDA